jgi:hypothetical protein
LRINRFSLVAKKPKTTKNSRTSLFATQLDRPYELELETVRYVRQGGSRRLQTKLSLVSRESSSLSFHFYEFERNLNFYKYYTETTTKYYRLSTYLFLRAAAAEASQSAAAAPLSEAPLVRPDPPAAAPVQGTRPRGQGRRRAAAHLSEAPKQPQPQPPPRRQNNLVPLLPSRRGSDSRGLPQQRGPQRKPQAGRREGDQSSF